MIISFDLNEVVDISIELSFLTVKKKKIKIHEKSSAQDHREEPTIDPLKVKPEVASQKEVIDRVRNDPSCGFLYMVYAVHPQNVYFTPYYLK